MSRARKAEKPTSREIARQWDMLAATRNHQILLGIDISYHRVLLPAIFSNMPALARKSVIDVGCGTGHLTSLLAEQASEVAGVDPSPASISFAEQLNGHIRRVTLFPQTVEAYSRHHSGAHHLAVANMVLMDCIDLDAALAAIYRILRPGGTLLATITHPCFWSRYWAYETESWFEYHKEIFVQAPFVISNEPTRFITTHIHRPLETYINAVSAIGFQLRKFQELFPSPDVEAQYPKAWKFPRYVIFRAQKPSAIRKKQR